MTVINSYHKDQYLFELNTSVVRVVWQEQFLITVGHGTQEKRLCNGIVLEDTVMFPEGGGQPPDHGTLTFYSGEKQIEAKVWYVVKHAGEIVHLIEEKTDALLKELEPGTKVHQKLDQARRLYHMKQHTGQHLISCLAEDKFQLNTVSWHLGVEISYIELNVKNSSLEDVITKMNTVEQMANSYIRENRNVKAKFIPTGEGHPELDKATTRGLPKNHVGDIRVIEIEGVNLNMCCGTHVSNLGSLEVIKFLGCKIKKKGYIFAYFVVGEEFFNKVFKTMKTRETKICEILNTNPDDCINKIRDQKEKLAAATKRNKALVEANALAQLEIFQLKKPEVPLFSFHSPDGGMDLLYFIAARRKELDVDNLTLLLTSGETDELNLFIAVSQDIMDQLIPQLLSLGGFGKNLMEYRFQGKLPLKSRPALESLVQDALRSKLTGKSVDPLV